MVEIANSMANVKVDLSCGVPKDRSYDILVERGSLSDLGQSISNLGFNGKCAVVTNPKVGGLYLEPCLKSLKSSGLNPMVIEIPDGEEFKNLDIASTVFDRLVDEKFERGSLLIALGGGVVGDLTGFVASAYLRGIPFIQVPTTLLSQVDSSVGGKTAVNHRKGKNLIGAFYQPKAVFIDPNVLKTLELREVRAGLAEVIKYGIIRDADFFSFLESSGTSLLDYSSDSIEKAIVRSCELKALVVSDDETETGVRAILNFGHTFGHAIEAVTGYKKYKHGEAISIGMVLASDFSVKLGRCGSDVSDRIKDLLNSLDLDTKFKDFNIDEILSAMKVDKKVTDGNINMVLLNSIGSVEIVSVDDNEVRSFLSEIS